MKRNSTKWKFVFLIIAALFWHTAQIEAQEPNFKPVDHRGGSLVVGNENHLSSNSSTNQGRDSGPKASAPSAAQGESTSANSRTIRGNVKDEAGNPLIGVNIIIAGSVSGTTTDSNGNFKLDIPAGGATLNVSYIGFMKQDIKVSNQTNLNIVLKEMTETMEELVVVGYTTQKKADLTGAVASVNMGDINDMAVSGINSALQGRMSGVTVLQSSGAPGSGTSIRIRGMGTFGNNDPLYIIDGMPADNMNDINPSDIARIDVLKDAASAAIYGSRAANGVVLITTKKGTASDKVNITFDTYHGFSSPQKKVKLLTAKQRNLIHLEAYQNAIDDGSLDIDPYQDPREYYWSDFAQKTRTNWQKEVFSDAAYQGNYDLSVSGGGNNFKYNIMGGHLTQEGILKNTSFDRTNFRINSEIDISKNFKIGENLMITHSKQMIVPEMGSHSGAITSALLFDPSMTPYDDNGNYNGSGPLKADLKNPVAIVNRADRKRSRNRIFGNVYAQLQLLKYFTVKTDLGYDWSKWQDKWFVARFPEPGVGDMTNELTQREWESRRWISTTTLKFERSIDRHNIMVMAGTSYEEFNEEFTNARGLNFISEDKSQRYLSAATDIAWQEGGREQWALSSYFGRLDYSFDSKYLLSASFRTDGSSKFRSGNRWGYFPSLSAGWRVSEESFFKSLKPTITNLKVRGSWGKLGNQDIFSNYPTKVIIRNTTYDDGYNAIFGQNERVTIGRYEATLPNPDVKWETTTQVDVGLDISLFNKLHIELDYYNKLSKDVLIQIPVTSLAGVTENPWRNAAKVRNKGFDANISYNTVIKDWKINVFGNFSTVSNEVRHLYGGFTSIFPSSFAGQNITRICVGEPIAHFYGYKTDGVFRTQEEIDNYKNSDGKPYQKDAKPGDVKFIDTDKSGSIDDNDRTKIGSGFPDFTYGFGADIKYKGFDLNFFFQGVSGYDILNVMKYQSMFIDPRYNQSERIMNRFHPVNNPKGSWPRVLIPSVDKNNNRRISDMFIENGNYLRLKALTFGYTFNENVSRKLHLNKLRVYVTMQNLFTISKYKGFDPELGETYANDPDRYGISEIGVDRGQFPQPKTFVIGLNINF